MIVTSSAGPRMAGWRVLIFLSGFFLAMAMLTTMARAQEGPGGVPIDVTADEGIEWRQLEKIYVARGNAKAVRGKRTLEGSVLTAHYREKSGGGTEVYSVEADKNVRILGPDQTVTGDRAVYDLDKSVWVITGQALKSVSSKETITAKESFEYWEKERVFIARGRSRLVQPERTVDADLLRGYSRVEADGSSRVYQLEATGNVKVVTSSDIVLADKMVYNLDKDIAAFSGNVRITREGRNQVNGGYAEVNFRSHISRILPVGNQRVHSLYIPGEPGNAPAGQ